jgi:hypothetical protein
MQQHEILKHIQHYVSKGIIHDALIPFFDQDGKWRGDEIKWQPSDLARESVRMRESFLPSSRRTRTTRSGTVLRTTFYRQGNESVMIKYYSIEGSLIVNGNAVIHAANLHHLGGHLITQSNARIYIPNLVSVRGNFEAMKGFLLKAPRLREVGGDMMVTGYVPPKLESVGGRLGVYWVFELNFTRLQLVGGSLMAPKAEVIIAPLLETIGGSFLANNSTRKVHTPKLRSIGGDFLIGSVTDLRAWLLRTIGGDMDTRCAKGYYHPAIRVGGQWTICPGSVEDWLMRAKVREVIRTKGGQLYL